MKPAINAPRAAKEALSGSHRNAWADMCALRNGTHTRKSLLADCVEHGPNATDRAWVQYVDYIADAVIDRLRSEVERLTQQIAAPSANMLWRENMIAGRLRMNERLRELSVTP